MKKMTCEAMGGPQGCTEMMRGSTAEEMVANGMDHMEEAHPDMAQRIKNNAPEENEKWMTEFRTKFDALPEN